MKKFFIHIASLVLTLGLVLNANASAINLTLSSYELEKNTDFSTDKETKNMLNRFLRNKTTHSVERNSFFTEETVTVNNKVIESYFEPYTKTTFLELHILHESFLL